MIRVSSIYNGCQKETVKTIVETKNHYIVWVKWNQPKLKKKIEKEIKKNQLIK